mmetsp:Transcript_32599/g.53177  ORF Transcript_32599/g.53177 Transcript_32599/m.53177 type:complete len:94 (+) Transcript_32599:901-1182(+)
MLTLLVHYWPYSNSHHCGYAMMDLSVALVMTNRASCTPMENLPDITKSSRYHAILALRQFGAALDGNVIRIFNDDRRGGNECRLRTDDKIQLF